MLAPKFGIQRNNTSSSAMAERPRDTENRSRAYFRCRDIRAQSSNRVQQIRYNSDLLAKLAPSVGRLV